MVNVASLAITFRGFCSQSSSQLSRLIDKTDVKSVLLWKRLQHRNIINYPPLFHQMTSLISVVPDGAALVVTEYVCVFACVRVRLCLYSTLCSGLFVHVCAPANLSASVRVSLCVCALKDKPLVLASLLLLDSAIRDEFIIALTHLKLLGKK